jgi:hypothetical protein
MAATGWLIGVAVGVERRDDALRGALAQHHVQPAPLQDTSVCCDECDRGLEIEVHIDILATNGARATTTPTLPGW